MKINKYYEIIDNATDDEINRALNKLLDDSNYYLENEITDQIMIDILHKTKRYSYLSKNQISIIINCFYRLFFEVLSQGIMIKLINLGSFSLIEDDNVKSIQFIPNNNIKN